MQTPPRLAHVVFMTRRFEEMIAWYERVFGAHVVHGDAALAFMTYDEEHHRFAFANLDVLNPQGDQAAEQGQIGVNHIAYTFASAADLLETYERLEAHGITPYWPIHHGITLSLYYQDPDGNRLEFQVEACNAEEANAYMKSPVFADNPIGFKLDADELLARYRAGASEADLLALPDTEPSPIPPEHGIL
jgi:catechol 2,3-dioxygenase-like lactoylglutathione lyase family enzyme